MMRAAGWAVVALAAAGCSQTSLPLPRAAIVSSMEAGFSEPAATISQPPLPLRVPIRGVMAGLVDFSAHGVFTTATAEGELSEADWLAAGLAAINLVSATTLITTAGAGPHDAEWVQDPEWRRWAMDMQAASINAGIAIRRKDRASFLSAADRLAQSCQSCHETFRIPPSTTASQFAAASGGDKSRTP